MRGRAISNSKDSWWYILVIRSTGKGREGSKDKRAAKCVWRRYDHTNDKVYVECYKKKKTTKQFVDFLKRVDRRYDKNILKNIFVVLDNLSVHKSKKAKDEISRCCPRIKLVFLPVRPPELNLIEARWS